MGRRLRKPSPGEFFPNFTRDNAFFQGFNDPSNPIGMRSAYYGFAMHPTRGQATPSMERLFEEQFRRVQNRFLASQFQQVAGGAANTQSYPDFLENFFSSGEAERDLYSLSPVERGLGTARFAPPVRFIQ